MHCNNHNGNLFWWIRCKTGMEYLFLMVITIVIIGVSCDNKNPVESGKTVSVTEVNVKPSTNIVTGETQQLTATVLPINATNKMVRWIAADNSIVTVSGSGLITGLKSGITVITVTTVDGGYSAQCTVTVVEKVTETVTDIDGNVYHTVTIGNQVWTKQNLRTTKFNDSTSIPQVTDGYTWLERTNPAFCYYNNTTDSDSIQKFGALYNWYAVNTRKLAPPGWRVPTSEDWEILKNYLIKKGYNWDDTRDSNKVAKSMATKTDWNVTVYPGSVGYNSDANNKCGFSAFPSGRRGPQGGFDKIGSYCYWWTATTYGWECAYYRGLQSFGKGVIDDFEYKRGGFSVRLIKE